MMELAEQITNEPSQDEILAFWDNHLEVQKHYLNGKNGRLNHVIEVLKFIVKSGMRVLDVGCGIGITSKTIGEMGAKVFAIDVSKKLINFAKIHNTCPNVVYWNANIMEIDDFLRKADLVVAVDVIEHLPYELSDICRQLTKFVKNDGVIFINIPDYRFAQWAENNMLDSRQIIDKAISLNILMDRMSIYNFQPVYLNIYGIDIPCQYNDIIFQHRDVVEKEYRKLLK